MDGYVSETKKRSDADLVKDFHGT